MKWFIRFSSIGRLVSASAGLCALFFSACAPRPGFPTGEASACRIMTFNIRMNTPRDGENAWPFRKEMAAGTIDFFGADAAGLQEVLVSQLRDLEALLPEYGWVGVGRDDGREAGEYCPIFFLKERFRLLESGTFWLSEDPETAGLKGWDAACARVVTRARLEDRESGAVLAVYNTHFDHVGETARRESARLLLRTIAAAPPGDAVVVTGDFNCTSEAIPYLILTGQSKERQFLRDARSVSLRPPYGSTFSFNGFEAGRTEGPLIDHIFVGPGVTVLRSGVLSDRWDGRVVSDHFPVVAEIRLPAPKGEGR
ncbi:MAG: endonuclease/exonuclease/phosphatase family protein [Candidatus Aminicenantes bacterium]|nr:endonuclease/exonuclease/phosphatase family protein [Candidatus Aminicenantes bacterium]